ncbi:MAG: phosphatidylserine decarboxylase [Syntrophaceae bacterium]|nr:phosphatidylserine decarboxylase [Syntrophaceae bacterium]
MTSPWWTLSTPSPSASHQYIDRGSRAVHEEHLYGDRVVRFLYSPLREHAPLLFRALTGRRISSLLGFFNYEGFLSGRLADPEEFMKKAGIDPRECLDPPIRLDTPKKIFERKIRYWECRPMPNDPAAVVSPADSRMLVGSLDETSSLFIKGKFFDLGELLGKRRWREAFEGGSFAVFRLTPDKYHYNHVPAAGKVADFYPIDGHYHACHPEAVVSLARPFSKNKRVVTVVDTDVPGGTGAGIVAMIEVVALMIGDIVQCYSRKRYDESLAVGKNLFLKRGSPKSLFRPGSSTVVLLFERNRVRFAEDIVWNMRRSGVKSIYTRGFGQPLAETEVFTRSSIGTSLGKT